MARNDDGHVYTRHNNADYIYKVNEPAPYVPSAPRKYKEPKLHAGSVKSNLNQVDIHDPAQLALLKKEAQVYNAKYRRYEQKRKNAFAAYTQTEARRKAAYNKKEAEYNEWLNRTKPVDDEAVRPLSAADTSRYRTKRKRLDSSMLDTSTGGEMRERRHKPVNQVGPAPWSSEYEGFKRVSKKRLGKAGYIQTQAGYVQSLGKDWDKLNKPEKKQVKLANGKTATVIDSHLGIPIGYQGPSKTITDDKGLSSLDYVAKVFDGNHKTYKAEGCGHIADMEYSAYYQLLKVHFVKGDATVVYFRVPSSVFGELYYLAMSKTTQISSVDFTERHVLGIRFWDIVRIRGTLHGSRYRFEYLQSYTPTGMPRGRQEGSGYFVNAVVDKRKPGPQSVNDALNLKPGEFTTIRLPKQDILEGWSIDDIEDYFEYGNYNSHLAKVKSNAAKEHLHNAYNLYNEGAGEEDILSELVRAYTGEPASFNPYIKGEINDSY